MIEAVRTTASAGATWAIIIVAVVCLAFWLGMVAWADMHPIWRHHRIPDMPGPVLGGMHLAEGGRSVAPSRDAPALFDEHLTDVPAQRTAAVGEPEPTTVAAGPARRGTADQPQPAAPTGGTPTMPAQRTRTADQPQPATPSGGTPSMPAQRTGDADQPEQSSAGPGTTDRLGVRSREVHEGREGVAVLAGRAEGE